ncbi:rCG45866 [Rattus norvegicus]|uniref:RCG45866 n=1 Tax=Rattus norvegicus TaxID=10116 RepID=A6JTZ3_RAT|nr:rCG45866 [Rattus norvegicus]
MQETLRSRPARGYCVSFSSKTETFHLAGKGLKQVVNSEWLQEVPDSTQVLVAAKM